MNKLVLALLGATVVTPAIAQTNAVVAPAAQPAVAIAPALAPAAAPAPVFQSQTTNLAYLRAGTPVALKMAEGLTTEKKKLRVGQRFMLEVADTVYVNGQAVIPAGSPATGEVTDVKNKGMWGKSGKINARVLSVRVGDRTIRMSGQLDDKGTAGGIGAVAVSALVFLPAGFFMTGTSARIPMGAPVKGFVDEDVQLAFAATAIAPLTVPMTSAPAPLVAGAASPASPAATTASAATAPVAVVTQPATATAMATPAVATGPATVVTGPAAMPAAAKTEK